MNSLGLADLADVKGTSKVKHPNAYCARLREASNGKDTMTGHWEMMGIYTTKPFVTFTDTGFPDVLIKELEEKTGHKIIGNYAASGTEILTELGEEQKEITLLSFILQQTQFSRLLLTKKQLVYKNCTDVVISLAKFV